MRILFDSNSDCAASTSSYLKFCVNVEQERNPLMLQGFFAKAICPLAKRSGVGP